MVSKEDYEIALKVISDSLDIDIDELRELDINYSNLNLNQILDVIKDEYRELEELYTKEDFKRIVNIIKDKIVLKKKKKKERQKTLEEVKRNALETKCLNILNQCLTAEKAEEVISKCKTAWRMCKTDFDKKVYGCMLRIIKTKDVLKLKKLKEELKRLLKEEEYEEARNTVMDSINKKIRDALVDEYLEKIKRSKYPELLEAYIIDIDNSYKNNEITKEDRDNLVDYIRTKIENYIKEEEQIEEPTIVKEVPAVVSEKVKPKPIKVLPRSALLRPLLEEEEEIVPGEDIEDEVWISAGMKYMLEIPPKQRKGMPLSIYKIHKMALERL